MAKESTQQLTVAIIGAGPLGRWLAWRAARSGFGVFLEDVLPGTLRHAREYIRQRFDPVALSQETGAAVSFVSTIEDAVRHADLAIDCVPDELESKLEILWLLDRMAPPQTILATPTTQLSIADLASCTYRPEKCIAIAAEPTALAELEAQPDATIPLCAGPATAAETVQIVEGFWRALGFRTQEQAEGGGGFNPRISRPKSPGL